METQSFKNRFDLTGRKVAVLSADGFEQSELTTPVEVLQTCGAEVSVLTPGGAGIRGWNDKNWGQKIGADGAIEDAMPGDYDALLLPGGVLNGDSLRANEDAREFARHFIENGKPVFAICHGPQLLISAGLVEGRSMTSFAAIAVDLTNAGAEWKDEEVVVDQGLVTSRTPDDLPAFCAKICEELLEGAHA